MWAQLYSTASTAFAKKAKRAGTCLHLGILFLRHTELILDTIVRHWTKRLSDVEGDIPVRAYWRLTDATFASDDLVFDGEANVSARRAWGVGRDVPASLASNRVAGALSGLREIQICPGEVKCRWPGGDWIAARREPGSARPWEDPLWLLDVLPVAVLSPALGTAPLPEGTVALAIDVAAAREVAFVPSAPAPRVRVPGRGNRSEPTTMRAWLSAEGSSTKWLRFVWPEQTRRSAAIWHDTRLLDGP